MNKIEDAIMRHQAVQDSLEQDRAKAVEATVNKTSLMELASYQDIRAMAQADGLLTVEESQRVYEILGGEVPTVEKWMARTTAEKLVAITLIGELMCAMHLGVDSRPTKKRRKR